MVGMYAIMGVPHLQLLSLILQEVEAFAEKLRAAGARIGVTGATASTALLRGKGDYGVSGIVHVGAALYGQQDLVPGTRPAARWLTRIATLKKACTLKQRLQTLDQCMHGEQPQSMSQQQEQGLSRGDQTGVFSSKGSAGTILLPEPIAA